MTVASFPIVAISFHMHTAEDSFGRNYRFVMETIIKSENSWRDYFTRAPCRSSVKFVGLFESDPILMTEELTSVHDEKLSHLYINALMNQQTLNAACPYDAF